MYVFHFSEFQVSDTASQPNILRDQVFHIQVMEEEVTTAVPTPAPGSKLGISVCAATFFPTLYFSQLELGKDC